MLERKLNELNIFALRDLARKTGVNSPTSKKKDELIKGIVEIMSGKKAPEVNKSKQGRPPKVFGYSFANVFNVDYEPTSVVALKQPTTSEEDEDILTIAGWVELLNNNSAILWINKNLKNDNYFISKEIIDNINIKTGDRIVAEITNDENSKLVKRIFSINDCPIAKMELTRCDYFSVEHNLPSRTIGFENQEINSLNLKIGENIYFYGSDNNQNTTAISSILNKCKIENKIYVNISLAEKNKIFLSNLKNCEMFVANITDEVDIVRRVLSLAIERAKRIMENGEDVLLVVDDMMSIAGVDKDNLNLLKKFASVAKDGKDKGSITLFAIMPNNSLIQIEKLADQRFKIDNNEIFKI